MKASPLLLLSLIRLSAATNDMCGGTVCNPPNGCFCGTFCTLATDIACCSKVTGDPVCQPTEDCIYPDPTHGVCAPHGSTACRDANYPNGTKTDYCLPDFYCDTWTGPSAACMPESAVAA